MGSCVAKMHLLCTPHHNVQLGTPAMRSVDPWISFVCPQFGMEMWARYAHKALWHDFQPGWALHKSHHEPRIGPFEVSDNATDRLVSDKAKSQCRISSPTVIDKLFV